MINSGLNLARILERSLVAAAFSSETRLRFQEDYYFWPKDDQESQKMIKSETKMIRNLKT